MPSLAHLFLLALAAPVLYFVAQAFYNVFMHPLRKIPGPKYLAANRWGYCYHLYAGSINVVVAAAHERYGDVVRVAPDEVSFVSLSDTAWQDIYGIRTGRNEGKQPYPKDDVWYSKSPTKPEPTYAMASACSTADHARQRRLLSHALSDKAIRAQEPILQRYVNLFIDRLREQCEGPSNTAKVDMVRWTNFLTFDIIGDLTFGQEFNCLRDNRYSSFALSVFNAVKALGRGIILRRNTWVQPLIMPFVRPVLEKRIKMWEFVCSLVDKRLSMETQRPDFMTFAMKHQDDEKGLTLNELYANAHSVTLAGTETTATTLAGVTYRLLAHPEAWEKLKEEIRERFKNIDEITIEEVNRTPYLLACLSEAMRMYPPVPTGFPRKVPEGGDMIAGHYIPGETSVYVSQWATNYSALNFKSPKSYIPERWLKDNEEFASDQLSACQPFSFGARNCIGKSLAYSEMRLVLAKTIWAFDMELMPESKNWAEGQKVYSIHEKPPLMVRLHPVQRDI